MSRVVFYDRSRYLGELREIVCCTMADEVVDEIADEVVDEVVDEIDETILTKLVDEFRGSLSVVCAYAITASFAR